MSYRLIIFAVIGLLLCVACSDDVNNDEGDQGSDGTDNQSGDTSILNGDSATVSTGDTNTPDSGTSSSGDTTGDTVGDTTGGDTTAGDTTGDTTSAVGDTTGDTTGDSSGWGTPTDSSGNGACVPVPCGGKVYGCADCLDNDNDGLVDWADPDCLGPCDNNESGFNIDIPGSDPSGCTMECYFDADNGTGNDECDWDYTCDTHNQFIKAEGDKHCPFDTDPGAVEYCDGLRASQAEACNRVCEPLVPNGCDCWGCCLLDGAYRYVGTPGCTLENLDACDPCTPVPSCENKCGECELCIGMTTLPDRCLTPVVDTDTLTDSDNTEDSDNTVDTDNTGDTANTGDTDNTDTANTGDTDNTEDTANTGDTDDGDINLLRCPGGEQPCGQVVDSPCPGGEYCLSGCCKAIVVE